MKKEENGKCQVYNIYSLKSRLQRISNFEAERIQTNKLKLNFNYFNLMETT